jgi:hypothetical protein
MAKNVRSPDTQPPAECRHIGGIVLDARRQRIGWRLRLAPTALVIEDELPPRRERGERVRPRSGRGVRRNEWETKLTESPKLTGHRSNCPS